jgi:hypothetical protein
LLIHWATLMAVNNRASATPAGPNAGSEAPEDQVKQEEPDVSWSTPLNIGADV